MREIFGDEVYEHYLFAVGNPNRVMVKDIYPDSEDSSAELEPGDIILNYASESIFSINDLKTATVGGDEGELVRLEFWRNGSIMSVTIARGPIGVEVEGVVQPPLLH